jgi:hypothetical protein
VLGNRIVAECYEHLVSERKALFKSYFGDDASRVKFVSEETKVPFNGHSYYQIDYNGEIPPELLKAYTELDKLDDAAPREKYKAERHKPRKLSSSEETRSTQTNSK